MGFRTYRQKLLTFDSVKQQPVSELDTQVFLGWLAHIMQQCGFYSTKVDSIHTKWEVEKARVRGEKNKEKQE